MNTFLIISLRTVIVVVLLTIALKIMGKREIGQLSIFDFLIVLSVADIMIICVENYDQSIWNSIIPLIIVVGLQKIVSIIDLNFPNIRKTIDGKPIIIIFRGKINSKTMKKEKYNMSDLFAQLREKNIRDISEVEYAILEINGNLSVFTYEENKDNTFPIPIIISGKVNKSALKLINKDNKWLNKELYRQGIKKVSDVMAASYKQNKLVIVNCCDDKKTDY